ncbi:hypothetical protein ACROYT_G028189 [Oculina patagonica]
MNRVRSACVKTNSSKTCFVSLSGDLAEAIGLRIQGQPFALQLQWTNGKAFTSWSGEVIHSKKHDLLSGSASVIQLGKKFADSLGLVEDQQVLVEPVVSIPSCNRISMDPVSANDWEILELHAGYIESQLLNQVRVVFPNQLLPIWIQNNMCVVVQVVNLEPIANCVRLDEFTEVVVSPKTRTFPRSKKEQQVFNPSGENITPTGSSEANDRYTEQEHATTSTTSGGDGDDSRHLSAAGSSSATNLGEQNVDDSGFMSRFSGYLHTLFYATDEANSATENQSSESLAQKGSTPYEEKWTPFSTSTQKNGTHSENIFDETDFNMCLRVQPELTTNANKSSKINESTFRNNYSLQPTTVFVDFASLPPLVLKSWTCNLATFPPPDGTIVKTVQISRLLSPKERSVSRTSSVGTSSRDNSGSKSKDSTNRDSESLDRTSQDATGQSPPDSTPADVPLPHWIVRMVMTSSINSAVIEQKSHELGVEEHVLPGHVAMSKDLSQLLGSKDLSLVKIQNISHKPSDIQGIILHPFGDTKQKLQEISADTALEAFQGWICSVCSMEAPLVLCSGMLLSFDVPQDQPLQFVVTVLSHSQTSNSTDSLPYYHLTPETLDNVTVVMGTPRGLVKDSDQALSAQESKPQHPKCSITDLGGVTEAFHKCLDHALSALGQRPLVNHLGGDIITGLRSGALLICGSGTGAGIGCGKTALAHAVCRQLQQWPVCAHVTLVDCIPFRGKRVDTIQKQWQQIFLEAAWHQPSVILFDDLDQVVSAPSALQEMGGEALYKRRLAQVFKDLITTEINNNSKVVVIATSKSHDSLHPLLMTSRGCHVFQCCAELHPPDNDQRKQILCAMLNKRFPLEDPEGLELSSLAKKTEGFSPKDLQSLLDRAFHRAAVRKMKKLTGDFNAAITTEDFKMALEGFTPAALRGVSLHTAGELGWSDVGGLAAVKGALMETLLWPTKYSWLFSKCPLRMRSGLLLYGPPGTGKTLLAGVVAKECGLNFISIKGPELLSKYIGASEQAIRDMFTRAQSAKPCILFFDEFDSLAPRRGHDSTGVTDRVVNQLLTQLDGVEGLDGVYVLAATSRPDLIDPALLRPGRLDKCLYCGMPDKTERLQILQALSRSLVLAQDTNLAAISDICEHFTGADFKALLYNAQLVAIHRTTSSNQLYKGVFSATGRPGRSDEMPKDPSAAVLTDEARENIIYIPSLVEGAKHVSAEEFTRLRSEVLAIHDNRQHSNSNGKISKTDLAKDQLAGGIQISQSDLLQAASSMGPSVSDNERRRYQEIYDTFIKSRGGDFSHNTPGQGKATLA